MEKQDEEGKELFKKWLERRNFKNITITEDQMCRFDMTADKNNIHYIFELKKRPIRSDIWNDSIIQDDKYKALLPYDKDDTKVYVVNLFYDCLYIVPLQYEHEEQHKYCQKTNNWNRNKVQKTLISYKHINKHKYQYDDNNNRNN